MGILNLLQEMNGNIKSNDENRHKGNLNRFIILIYLDGEKGGKGS